ncbi:MAG: polyprenyl synthetase family protein, partial [Anaerolineales bacterium]|nr:polyprenyl synthetase family protein [Anaerolineales bacterium]
MKTSLQETLNLQLQEVEKRLKDQVTGNYPPLVEALSGLISTGGKRVRPRLTLLMGQLLGANPQRLLDLAAAIEMLHTATLVHDDLIDGALLRRGAETLHTRWTPATTVLAGDLVFALAARLAAASDSVQVMALFSETLQIIVNGEITNLLRPEGGLDRQAYYEWI